MNKFINAIAAASLFFLVFLGVETLLDNTWFAAYVAIVLAVCTENVEG